MFDIFINRGKTLLLFHDYWYLYLWKTLWFILAIDCNKYDALYCQLNQWPISQICTLSIEKQKTSMSPLTSFNPIVNQRTMTGGGLVHFCA